MGIYGTKKYGKPAACPPISRLLDARSSGSVSPDILSPGTKSPRTKSPRIKSPTNRPTKPSVIKASLIKANGNKFIGRKRFSELANAVVKLRDLYNLDGYRSNLEPVTLVEYLKDKSPRKRNRRNRNRKVQQQQQQQQNKRRHHLYRQLSQKQRKELLHAEQLQSLQPKQENEPSREQQKKPSQKLPTCANGRQDLITPIVNSFKTLVINTTNNLKDENSTAKAETQDSNDMDEYSREMAARPKCSNKNTTIAKPMPSTINIAENNNVLEDSINATKYSDEMDDYSREIAARTGAYPKRSINKVATSMLDNNSNDASSSKALSNLNESYTDHTGNELYSAMHNVLSSIHVWAPNPQTSPNYQPIQVQPSIELSPAIESSHPWCTLDSLLSSPVELNEVPDEPEVPARIHPFVFCHQCEAIARFHCRTCAILMCSKCFCAHHPSHDSSQFQRPTGNLPNDFGNRPQQHDRCKLHGLVITQICIECNVCTCDQCWMTKHAGHKRLLFARFVQKIDRFLRNTASDGCASIAIIRQSIDRAGQLTKNINQDYQLTHSSLRKAVFQFYRTTGHHHSQLLMEAENTRFQYTQYIQRYTYAMQESLNQLVRDVEHIDRTLNFRHRPDMDDYELASAALECRRRIDYFKQVMTIQLQPMYMGIGITTFEPNTLAELKVNSDPSTSQVLRTCTRRIQQPEIPTSPVNAFVMNKTCHEDRDLVHSWSMPSQAIWNLPDLLSVRLETRPSRTFALEGSGPGEVNRPWGVCVDSYGNIIVGDRRNNRVQMFAQDGTMILQFGCKGRNNGEFDLPAGVCVDISQKIYVVDKDNHRVQVFTHAGVFLFKFGTYGSKNGQFQYPWDVAVNTVGEIVVSDSRNHRIQLFTSSGRFMSKLCFKDLPFSYQPKNFTTPRGICFTPNGDIIVSDFEHHRLILVDGRLQGVRAIRGLNEDEFLNLSRPSGVCCDDDGRVIVADSKNARLMVFSPDLDFILCIPVRPTYGPGSEGNADPAERDRPCDLAILPSGRLVVIVEASPETRALVREQKTFCKIY